MYKYNNTTYYTMQAVEDALWDTFQSILLENAKQERNKNSWFFNQTQYFNDAQLLASYKKNFPYTVAGAFDEYADAEWNSIEVRAC